MILKNSEGEVRLIWLLLLLVIPFLIAAYLLRYIPIRIQTTILINQGLSESTALSQARTTFLEKPIGSSLVGLIQGLLWYPIVCFLIRRVNKKNCDLKSLGLALGMKKFLLIPLGLILGLVMYFGYFLVGSFFNQGEFVWSPVKLGTTATILVSLNFIINGLGEETAFRAYWQDRLIHRHGLWIGIILASASFVLLHLLLYHFSVEFLVSSILLACLYGILYVWTGSIFLVGTMHAVFNLTPQLLQQWPSDAGIIIVNSIALALATIIYLWFRERHRL